MLPRVCISVLVLAAVAHRDEPAPPPAAEPAPPPPGEVTTAPVEVGGTRETDGAARTPDAARALEEPAFVTVVHLDDRRGETLSAAEALAETVGVTVRSLGGLGAFASRSMRAPPTAPTPA